MIHFCTLFDSAYLSRGLALYKSLLTHVKEPFRLYVLTMDDVSHRFLTRLSISNLIPIAISTIEDRKMKEVKPTRTRGEYCWTATSCWVHYLLETFKLPQVIYCDADTFFYSSPEALIKKQWDASVMLTPHFYTPVYDKSEQCGSYCVQFMPFKNDETGRQVVSWWREACLNWCYDRIEEGLFGDQKYLDEMPKRFDRIHIIKDRGYGVAPWNVQQYEFEENGKKVVGRMKDSKEKFDVVFFHFHALKYYEKEKIDLGQYQLSLNTVETLYRPYVKQLDEIHKQYPNLKRLTQHQSFTGLDKLMDKLKRQYRGTHNVYTTGELSCG